jgi:leucyl aminopeptidase
VHLDIAGPAFAKKAHALGPEGGTGFGVRTVLKVAQGLSEG